METIWRGGLTRDNRWRIALIIAIGFFAIVSPAFSIYKSLPSIRPEEALLFGVFGINVLIYLGRHLKGRNREFGEITEKNPHLRTVNIIFLALTLSTIISDFWGVLVLDVNFSFRDIMEFVTFLKYYLILTLVVSVDWSQKTFRKILYGLTAGLGVDLLFTFMQSINVWDINNRFLPLIAPPVSVSNLLGNPARTIGTLSNPNFNALLFVMGLVLLVCLFYFKGFSRGVQVGLVIAFILVMKGMMMNISRMAILATALSFSYISIRYWLHIGWKKELFIKVGIIFVCTVLIWYTAPRSFTARMAEAKNFTTSTSIQGHFDRWSLATNDIKVSPILGWGSAKSEMTTLVDNEYLLIMRRYGIPGLLSYVALFLTSFWHSHQLTRRDSMKYFGVALEGITLGILLFNTNAGIFYQLQLMSVYSILIGLVYAARGKEGYL